MLTPGSEIGIVADLTQCEHEPIRTPGSVQAHGVLIALSEPDLRIRQISENCSEFLGQPADALTGQSLATLYDEEFYKTLKEKLLSSTHKELNPLRLYLRSGLGRRAFNGIAHRTNQSLILELEPISLRDNEPSLGFYQPARPLSVVLGREKFARTCECCRR